jgi:Fic family protein
MEARLHPRTRLSMPVSLYCSEMNSYHQRRTGNIEVIHPLDDGNGRVGRAIADHALSQSLGYPTTACLATAIEGDKKSYYLQLEKASRGSMDVNVWLARMVSRVFAEGRKGFEGGITTRKYEAITKCPNRTASRDLSDLVTKGIIIPLPGGGRTMRYELTIVKPARPGPTKK